MGGLGCRGGRLVRRRTGYPGLRLGRFDSIDRTRPILWSAASTFCLEWRANALPPLAPLTAAAVSHVELVDHRGELKGLAFTAQAAFVELYNALDELGLKSTRSHDPDTSYLPA